MKNILITGGAGSIGRELAQTLAARGHTVAVLDVPRANFAGFNALGVEVIPADITDAAAVATAVAGRDVIVHLAGILPPASEMKPQLAMSVNLDGTKNLVDAIAASGNRARLIFSSTVATYGDTTGGSGLVGVDTPQNPNSVYSRSKYEAEQYMMSAGIDYTILRVAAVFLAALTDPPLWPMLPDQRCEFVFRDDVVTALLASVETDAASKRVFMVTGGKTWQMLGREFVAKYLEILDVPEEDAEYPEKPVYSDWYNSAESEALLHYQNTSFESYLEKLRKAVDEAVM